VFESYNATAWLLDRHVDAGRGQAVAIVSDGEEQRYDDVQRDVWRAQHALRDLDVRPGERVAMVVNDEPAFIAWFLAAIRAVRYLFRCRRCSRPTSWERSWPTRKPE